MEHRRGVAHAVAPAVLAEASLGDQRPDGVPGDPEEPGWAPHVAGVPEKVGQPMGK